VVATPIGNPGDLSPRAREVLESAALVLAEDTRRAGLLCKRLGIAVQRLESFFEHNEEAKVPRVLEALGSGDVALVTDAGTPLLSDPGYRLVRACRAQGVAVSPVPGPSAVTAALSASGLPPQPFVFLGFMPRKAAEVRKALQPYAALGVTLVFFERKNRLSATLDAAHQVLGNREVCVARELTKTHEQFILAELGDRQGIPSDLLGEVTVVVGPPLEAAVTPAEEVDAVIAEERQQGGGTKDMARRVRDRVRGWSVKALYERMR
jgi:16S rRNA (cytidine1402-2'-O)-methyltransferase